MYFEALNAAVMAIECCFEQNDYSIFAKLEQLLLLAATQKDYTQTLQEVTDFYGQDFNASELETHLEVFSHMEWKLNQSVMNIHSETFIIIMLFKSLTPAQLDLTSQVARLVKLVLLMPVTNAVSERSTSAMQRIQTYLRSIMTQSRLNNVMVLHVHKHLTDTIDHTSVLNEFALANDERKLLGLSSELIIVLHSNYCQITVCQCIKVLLKIMSKF